MLRILSCVYMFISFMTTLLHTLEYYFAAFFSTFFAFQYVTVCYSRLELLLNSIYGNNKITKKYYYVGFKESLLCHNVFRKAQTSNYQIIFSFLWLVCLILTFFVIPICVFKLFTGSDQLFSFLLLSFHEQHGCGQLTFLWICFGVVHYIIQDYLRVESFHLLPAAALPSVEAIPHLLFIYLFFFTLMLSQQNSQPNETFILGCSMCFFFLFFFACISFSSVLSHT